jgi:hypothetical protein
MPRRTRLKPWRGDRWHGCVYSAIERRVRANLDQISAPLGVDDPTEQAALVEAVTVELRRAWAYLRDVQNAASNPAARHILRELLQAGNLVAEVERADPTVRYLIEIYDWPSRGKGFLEVIQDDPPRLRKAISRALRATMKDRKRGKPKGSIQFSEHVLADGLANVFERFGGRATRRHAAYGGYDYGPFKDFIGTILGIIPQSLQRSSRQRKSDASAVDYMIRLSARHPRRTPQKSSIHAGYKGDLLSIIARHSLSSESH